jgi:phosphoglycolate phosphatase
MLMLNTKPEDAENGRLPVGAVIFDLDGTLVNTTEIYFRVIDAVLDRLGLPPVSREVILDAAKDGEFEWERMLPEHRRQEKDKLLKQMWAVRDELFPVMLRERTTLIPGADDLLKKIHEGGTGIGLVTSTPRRNLEYKWIPLGEPGIKHFFSAIITADDVEKRKPSPEAFVACAEKLGVEVKRCMIVGDTRTDIIAGKGAGMITVGVLTGFDTHEQLKAECADLIIDSVAELLEKLEFSD